MKEGKNLDNDGWDRPGQLEGRSYPSEGHYWIRKDGAGYRIYDVDKETPCNGVEYSLADGNDQINIRFKFERVNGDEPFPLWRITPRNGQSVIGMVEYGGKDVLYWLNTRNPGTEQKWDVAFDIGTYSLGTGPVVESGPPKTPQFVILKKQTAESR